MVCGQLCEETTSERTQKGEDGEKNEVGRKYIGGTGWTVCFYWDKREAGISTMNKHNDIISSKNNNKGVLINNFNLLYRMITTYDMIEYKKLLAR